MRCGAARHAALECVTGLSAKPPRSPHSEEECRKGLPRAGCQPERGCVGPWLTAWRLDRDVWLCDRRGKAGVLEMALSKTRQGSVDIVP